VLPEASTKPHVHQKFEIFWTNIASTMAYPNFKKASKMASRTSGVKGKRCEAGQNIGGFQERGK
jgi:hypothetical protein